MAESHIIRIVDVTNRDGVQTSRLGLAKLEKTIINVLLNEMGVYRSEFGFPFTAHEKHYLNANLQLKAKACSNRSSSRAGARRGSRTSSSPSSSSRASSTSAFPSPPRTR